MKNIVLGIELFTIYFSTICCLTYKPKKEETVLESRKEEDREVKEEEKRSQKNIERITPEEEISYTPPSTSAESNNPKKSVTEWEIDFTKLSIKACRKIAGELTKKDREKLGISQKVNQTNKPVEQLRREIKSRWRHHKEEVDPIVRSHCNDQAKVKKAVALTGTSEDKAKSA